METKVVYLIHLNMKRKIPVWVEEAKGTINKDGDGMLIESKIKGWGESGDTTDKLPSNNGTSLNKHGTLIRSHDTREGLPNTNRTNSSIDTRENIPNSLDDALARQSECDIDVPFDTIEQVVEHVKEYAVFTGSRAYGCENKYKSDFDYVISMSDFYLLTRQMDIKKLSYQRSTYFHGIYFVDKIINSILLVFLKQKLIFGNWQLN